MTRWRVEFDAAAARELRALGHSDRLRVQKCFRERIATGEDPRRFGKSLTGDLQGLWRYRVGDIRIVATFENEVLVVLVLRVGHRREVYD
ncbi:type II toxin-antitoxin system RelE/ParE family toxin [Nostoc sp. NIES-2111]